MRSAWLKFARAVEHQKVLAAASRTRDHGQAYEYQQFDNRGDGDDPLVRIQWRLRIREPYPERWGLLIGDCLVNFRAALDHAVWAAVQDHSGPPRRPESVNFPICPTSASFKTPLRDVRPLLAPRVWELIEAVQPLHGGEVVHTSPLEILRYLNNRDKHRTLQLLSLNFVNLFPIEVHGETPVDVVEQWQKEGPVQDGDVVARLKFRRPVGDRPAVDVAPVMAHRASLQISDNPVEYRDLASLMDGIREEVLLILAGFGSLLGDDVPTDLYLGDEHDAVAPGGGGDQIWVPEPDGSRARWTGYERGITSE